MDFFQPVIDLFQIDLPHLFIMFIIYSFFGWCGEEVWCGCLFRKIAKRGMLYGLLCPIYGFGALGILYLLYPFRQGYVVLFFTAVLVTSTLEYITSWILEKLFHAAWWDYSEHPFNINGRVCLLNSVAFGLAGVAMIHFIHPLVLHVVYWDSIQPAIPYIAGGLAVILATDMAFTLRKLVDFNTAMAKAKAYSEHLKVRFEGEDWFKPQSFQSMIESIKEKAAADSSKFSKSFMEEFTKFTSRQKGIESWIRRFPTMKSKEYSSVLEHAKKSYHDYVAEQKRLLKLQKDKRKERVSNFKEEMKKPYDQRYVTPSTNPEPPKESPDYDL